MALIKCPECEKEISDQAKCCVHCGFPISKEHTPPQGNVPSNTLSDSNKDMIEDTRSVIKNFLKNKKAVKRSIIVVVIIVLAITAACIVHNNHMEKVTLEQLEEHIENEEFEFAFDKINSGYISDEDMEKYREIVIPHMQDEFADAKKSEKETLSLIVDGTEYFFYDGESFANSDDKIYTYIYTREDDERTILYEVPEGSWDLIGGSYISDSYYLDPNLCMYANNCLFFIEEKSIGSLTDRSEYYALKYLDLNTGISKEIGSDEYFRGMYKLEDGSIFVQYSHYYHDGEYPPKRNPCGGIRYNPYTKTMNEGESVVTEEELENAVYKCN